ncbi:hypothetical protein P8452_76625 [Trifolium repens]|nr:hypothetical protein P8452_76625 [Trifolium repens]
MYQDQTPAFVGSEQQPVGWPGGPIDVSLLTQYEHHVSRYIWLGQERLDRDKPGLRIASLGEKVNNWVPDEHPGSGRICDTFTVLDSRVFS